MKHKYLIITRDGRPYVLKGRLTVLIKNTYGGSNRLFKIENGVVSMLKMTGHFTEKDPWSWVEVGEEVFRGKTD